MKQVAGLALTLILLVPVMPTANGEAAAAAKTSYTGHYGDNASDKTAVLKPKWQAQMDNADGGSSNIAMADGKVYYSFKEKIIAADVTTGKARWTYNSYHSTPLLAGGGNLFFVNPQGYLIKLNGKTGAVSWKTKAADASDYVSNSLRYDNSILYIFDKGISLTAYDESTGKRKWAAKLKDDGGWGEIQGIYNGVVVINGSVSGAITTVPYFGFDAETGRQLWKLDGIHSDVLDEQGGYLYLRNNWPVLDNGYAAVIDKVDTKTGKVVQTLSFIPEEDVAGYNATQVVIEGNSIYIEQQVGRNRVSVFSLDQEPENQKPKVYTGYGKWVAGPYLGQLYFVKDLKLIRLKEGGYGVAVNGANNPVSQLDLIGQGAFIGLTDGQFILADAATGKAAGKLQTGSRQYGATKVENGMAIIQAENRLLAVALPSALAK
ncbi:PQQ-binding-like beta-propeller repeat protein [Cohnella terricola]|nr:PQQ-binding-like beta-propeller repeat protein [Cohnella terricola]